MITFKNDEDRQKTAVKVFSSKYNFKNHKILSHEKSNVRNFKKGINLPRKP